MENKKEDFIYRVISLFNIFLIVSTSIVFSILISPNVLAAPVCCAETLNGDFCSYVDSSECKEGALAAPTSCEQTTYCKTVTCVDTSNTGLCYSSMPQAKCETEFNGKAIEKPIDQVPECKRGCCLIGSQAEFVTETKCRNTISKFPELEMDFREVENEQACISLAKSTERGCCVNDKLGTYITRGNCEGEFFAGQYCSQIPNVQCVAANPSLGGRGNLKDTGCVDFEDSVFWFDSCGNPEGVKEKCNYFEGSICGDSDKNNEFKCESVACDLNANDYSVELEGYAGTPKTALVQGNRIDNGESWCVYDSPSQDFNAPGPNQDPVGSRYFRSVCINNKEFVEPCKDFRQEFCLSANIPNTQTTTAACLENRATDCSSNCNTADPFEMNEDDYSKALQADQECCLAVDKRDCSWTGSKCVPKVSPGFKHWENEGADRCSQADMSCKVILHCGGWNSILSACEKGSGENVAASMLLGLGTAALATWASGGVALIPLISGIASGTYVSFSITSSDDTWTIIHGKECLTQEFLQAANNVCRSQGDCGADVNYLGVESRKGFVNTEGFYGEWKNIEFGLGSKTYKLSEMPGKFKEPLDWNKGNKFFDVSKKEPDKAGFFYRFFVKDVPYKTQETSFFSSDITKYSRGGFGLVLLPVLNIGLTSAMAASGTGVAHATMATFSNPLGQLVSFVSEKFFLEKGEKLIGEGTTNALKEAASAEARAEMERKLTTAGTDISKIAKDLNIKDADKMFPSDLKKEILKETEKQAVKEGAKTTAQQVMAGVNTFMWVYTIYNLGNTILASTESLEVKSTCKPWVAPNTQELGGKDKCELCNPEEYKDVTGNPKNINALKQCSEYKCKSLGSNCQLINEGTEEQKCVSMDPRDVNPPKISAYPEGLDEGFREIEEKGTGYRIKKEIPIYQTVNLAIKTDEPSQCKFDVKKGIKYEEMPENFFGSASYKYFHLQQVFYPSSKNMTSEAAAILGPGNKHLFVRCADSKGKATENDYVVEFSVSAEPDVTPPEMKTTSIGSEAFLTHGTNITGLSLYVNEPGKCRWSTMPSTYDLMPADTECRMQGPNNLGIYECRFEGGGGLGFGKAISGIEAKSGEHKFVYFKCKDAENNFNQDPFRLTLKGSDMINITGIKPEGQIMTGAQVENVTLQVTTVGGARGDGTSECKFTQREADKNSPGSMIRLLETNASMHRQTFENLPSGDHSFFVSCFDEAGNVDFKQTQFRLMKDELPPIINRVYRDDTFSPTFLVLQTNEEGTCQYSDELFNFGEGSLFLQEENMYQAPFDKDIYYLTCKDNFGNVMGVNKVQVLE